MKVNLLNLTAAHNHHLWPHLNKQKPNCTSTYQLSWYIIVMRQSSPIPSFLSCLWHLYVECGCDAVHACGWVLRDQYRQYTGSPDGTAVDTPPLWKTNILEYFFGKKLILMWNYFLHFFSKSNPQDHVPSDNRLSTGRQEKRKNLKIHFEI